MKFLKTVLKGRLTGLGVVGIVINDLLSNWTDVAPTWEAASGGEVSALQIVSAVAVLWGVVRRFTKSYKEA